MRLRRSVSRAPCAVSRARVSVARARSSRARSAVAHARSPVAHARSSLARARSAVVCLFATLALSLSLSACAYYSFTGATIPEHIETVAIPLTEDVSANPFSDLGGSMNRTLVDRFVGQTRLRLETDEAQADALLTTEIQGYSIRPAAVGGENTAQLNRLTITAVARYVDQENGEEMFDRTFTASVEYNPEDLATEQEAALQAINDIVEDIFTAATSDW